MFADVISLISRVITAGGAVTIVVGGLTFISGAKDKDGSKKNEGLWEVVAGAGIIALALLVSNITI